MTTTSASPDPEKGAPSDHGKVNTRLCWRRRVPKAASTPEVPQRNGLRRVAPSRKRPPYKFSEIMDKRPPISSEGYARVAWLMARTDTSDLAIFRKFGELNMLNLLRLQAELVALQHELGILYEEEESRKRRYSFKELRKHERLEVTNPQIQDQYSPVSPQPFKQEEGPHMNDIQTPKMHQAPEQDFQTSEEQAQAEMNFSNERRFESDSRARENHVPSEGLTFEEPVYTAGIATINSQHQPADNLQWPSNEQNDPEWEDQIGEGQQRTGDEPLTYDEWSAIEQQRQATSEEWRANQDRDAFMYQRTTSSVPLPPDIDPEDSDAGSAYRPNALHKHLKRIERKLKAYST
jgi:hypothetical protein